MSHKSTFFNFGVKQFRKTSTKSDFFGNYHITNRPSISPFTINQNINKIKTVFLSALEFLSLTWNTGTSVRFSTAVEDCEFWKAAAKILCKIHSKLRSRINKHKQFGNNKKKHVHLLNFNSTRVARTRNKAKNFKVRWYQLKYELCFKPYDEKMKPIIQPFVFIGLKYIICCL